MINNQHAESISDPLDIHRLFPPEVVCASASISDTPVSISLPEQMAVAHAALHRRQEFAFGRACAHKVLKQLGCHNPVLLQGDDGIPLWPTDIVGSITHTNTWCAVAAARSTTMQSIGIDIETIERVSPRITAKVMTPEEMLLIKQATAEDAQLMLCLVFSAKEAVYKCLYPVWRKKLRFHDATIIPHDINGTFEVLIKPEALPHCQSLSGRYVIQQGIMCTGVMLPR